MPSVSLLLWVFTRALLLPHEPYVAPLATPGDYPASGSVDGLIETAVPAVLSDRFDASGTGVGRPALLGAYGGSFTDTTFRIGDLDVTSPLRPGTPLVLPDTVGFDSVAITEAPSLTAESAPGVRVAVTPRRPAARPTMAIEAALAPPRWTATASDPPAVAALGSAGDASVVWSGPLRGDRLGAVVGAHWTRARSTVRGRSEPAATLASAMAHIVAKGRHDDEWRTLLTIQHADHASALWPLQTTPLIAHDRMGLAHLTWARDVAGRLGWTVSAGYQRAFIDPATASGVTRVDSVLDGSILPMMLDPAGRTDALRVAADVRGAVSDQTRHAWRVGGSIDAAWMRPDLLRAPGVDELVSGTAARAWRFDQTGSMRWRQATSTLYAADRITLGPHLRVQAGLRLESVRATNGSATVAWTSVFPRVGVDVPITPSVHVFADLSRAGLPLPPAALAFGDPRAPTGRVYPWHDLDANGRASTGEFGPLVARVGPGAGPAGLSSIDPHLIRPTQAQGLLGLAVERSRWTFSLTAIVRRQADLIQPVDAGAAYTARVVADAGLSYPDPPTDTLTVFDRTASSFGADAYVLTNPPGLTDRFEGLDASLQLRSSRISLAFGATAARTRASTVGRGFRVAENDPGVLDVSANPNALVNAIGRPFADRGYTGKVALAIRLPAETRLGLLVRYQDGQPFSRLSVISDLAQGAEPVRSYAPGRTRFTFVGTIDARLQKRLRAGRGRVDLVLDVFNLLDARREVEEIVASTPSFRVTSAVAPPRSARLALRVGF